MSDEQDDLPPRLLASGSNAQRELLEAAKLEAPAPAARRAGMEQVLERRAAERRSVARWRQAGLLTLVAAAAVGLFWRSKAPSPVTLVGEPPPSASALRQPLPVSSVPAPDDALAPCAPATVAAGREPLIDDFEDGDTRLPWLERRGGFWVIYNDGSGQQRPRPGTLFVPGKIPGGRGTSKQALHVSGTQFKLWGAAVSAELNPKRCYDASAYGGIQFWARGSGRVDVSIMMTQMIAEQYGGSCVGDCSDAHYKTIKLEKSWTLYRIRWDDLVQRGSGRPVPFDARSLFAVTFMNPPQLTPFEYWLDDLSFVPRE